MRFQSILSRVGSWSFILVGFGHVGTSILAPDTPDRAEILRAMREFPITMGGTESNLLLFHEGFSLMMGLMLFGYGLLNLSLHAAGSMSSSRTLGTNATIASIAFALSVRHFFIVPNVLLGIASLCFVTAFALRIGSRR